MALKQPLPEKSGKISFKEEHSKQNTRSFFLEFLQKNLFTQCVSAALEW